MIEPAYMSWKVLIVELGPKEKPRKTNKWDGQKNYLYLLARKSALFTGLGSSTPIWFWSTSNQGMANFCAVVISTSKKISTQIVTGKYCLVWADHLKWERAHMNSCWQVNMWWVEDNIIPTILSAPTWLPKQDLQTSCGHGGHDEPGVGSIWLFSLLFFGFNVNSGSGGGVGPWHLLTINEQQRFSEWISIR